MLTLLLVAFGPGGMCSFKGGYWERKLMELPADRPVVRCVARRTPATPQNRLLVVFRLLSCRPLQHKVVDASETPK